MGSKSTPGKVQVICAGHFSDTTAQMSKALLVQLVKEAPRSQALPNLQLRDALMVLNYAYVATLLGAAWCSNFEAICGKASLFGGPAAETVRFIVYRAICQLHFPATPRLRQARKSKGEDGHRADSLTDINRRMARSEQEPDESDVV